MSEEKQVQLGNCKSLFAGMLLKHFCWELRKPFFCLVCLVPIGRFLWNCVSS